LIDRSARLQREHDQSDQAPVTARPAYGLLTYPGHINLGDTIQSLAARHFLPQVDALVVRERISAPPPHPGPLRTILNGWYMDNPQHWPPHPAIVPLPVSMHIVEPDRHWRRRWKPGALGLMTAGAGGDWLRRWGPIGTRDLWTLEQFEARGIPAWHSGCLTLTLPQRAVPRGQTVVACDLPDAALKVLRRIAPGPLLSVSHQYGAHLSHTEQVHTAERLLDAYAGAAAVVTTRIHCALPCLALGTPVLLLHNGSPERRVSDMLTLLHSASFAQFAALRHDFDLAAPPPNPEAFRPFAAKLNRICAEFVAAD
jgi:hypothetical protein